METLLTLPLGAVAADGPAPAINTTELGLERVLTVEGDLVANVQGQGSIDGVNWASVGSAITNVGTAQLDSGHKYMRVLISGYASGSGNVFFSGPLARRRG